VTPDPSVWAQYGPATVSASVFAAVAWYLLKMVMKSLDIERTLNDEYRTEIRELNKSIHDKYIPALTKIMGESAQLTQATAEITRALQDAIRRDRER